MGATRGSGPSEAQVLEALRRVQDPELGRDVVSLGMIKDLKVEDGRVSFTLELTTPACPLSDQLEREARAAVEGVPGVQEVQMEVTARVRGIPERRPIPGVENVIAVASGKGGVGKSTVAVNLAVALAQEGARVGLLDADVYGPSAPTMLGVHDRPHVYPDGKIQPLEAHGVRVMSVGFLIAEDQPVIWRGPMAHQLIQQFLLQVRWGELDYLIVDLPPGTGDVQLTLTQTIPLSGAIIVTTPQKVALVDAVKGLEMFRQVNVPVLGIVENMSYFLCPHCGERTYVFAREGGRRLAEERGVPLLGEIPLEPAVMEASEEGEPIVLRDPESATAQAFRALARAAAGQMSIAAHRAAEAPSS